MARKICDLSEDFAVKFRNIRNSWSSPNEDAELSDRSRKRYSSLSFEKSTKIIRQLVNLIQETKYYFGVVWKNLRKTGECW